MTRPSWTERAFQKLVQTFNAILTLLIFLTFSTVFFAVNKVQKKQIRKKQKKQTNKKALEFDSWQDQWIQNRQVI